MGIGNQLVNLLVQNCIQDMPKNGIDPIWQVFGAQVS